MSKTFEKFSDSARLYAKYASVVDQMHEAFNANVVDFLQAVHEGFAARVDQGVLRAEPSNKYRAWWIEDEETKGNSYPPFIWTEIGRIEVVNLGQLTFTVAVENLDEDLQRQLMALESKLRLPSDCKSRKYGKLFAVDISYGKSDPVGSVCEAGLILMKAIREVEGTVLRQKAKVRKEKRKSNRNPT